MTTIQVRTPSKTKANVQKILSELGLDMSTAINIYLVQIEKHGGIPFPLITENGMTEEQENEILREIADAKRSKKVYSSAKEAHKAILGS
ncbi:type II toxin-antitoxin system RelB/DinJ family antitoxin [Candidatus Peribacteria bacterium]|nr:type II toxin-antitoxin system RelB/DinJ family antitoxin [Candidatus Peribacteria bacterium]MBT4021557.1 type II toxin-antitoxin system RelB/DinJ family antitoxin [Candidatus Peribacteria bacterium]MBT4240589.1 type II toxin-antitoxin system RelB/DinJ family antitoxin [Candidatus Peribacteria bacterium]MBT4474676.1 type II toxin-antitoxin system RelB/DinJ family antitoxin [Candidatus Peribacteria bacterium]